MKAPEPRSGDRAMRYDELMHRLSHCSDCDCEHAAPRADCECDCHGLVCGKIGRDAERIVWMCVLSDGHDGECSYEQRIGRQP